jgi:hypothetical protein
MPVVRGVADLRQVKAAALMRAYSAGMVDVERVTEVKSGPARCSGEPWNPHDPVEIALEPNAVAACPVCSRRFRRAAPIRIDRAAWPKED